MVELFCVVALYNILLFRLWVEGDRIRLYNILIITLLYYLKSQTVAAGHV